MVVDNFRVRRERELGHGAAREEKARRRTGELAAHVSPTGRRLSYVQAPTPPGSSVGYIDEVLRLVERADQVQKDDNAERDTKQPEQKIATHFRSPSLPPPHEFKPFPRRVVPAEGC